MTDFGRVSIGESWSILLFRKPMAAAIVVPTASTR
jgi:hypothetical protein